MSDIDRKMEISTGDLAKHLNRAMVEIFGKDIPEGTNLYSRDK